jgi:protein-disulfide isomerase
MSEFAPINRRDALGGLVAIAGSAMLPGRAAGAARPAGLAPPPLLGKPTAPKRLLLWGSLTCPFTAMLAFGLKQIQHDMPARVAVEWRHFPTHKPDPGLHVAALAFGGQHFWNYALSVLKIVYDANGQFAALTDDKMVELAIANGGTRAGVEAALADQSKWAAVRRDLMAGKLLGVTRTPGLFFNGYFLTPDGIPNDFAAFNTSLRKMLVT